MVWELTIPTYKNWIYGGLTPNSPGSDPVILYTDYKNIPTDPDGTLSYCRFDGSHQMIYSPDRSVISTGGWPAWVTDLEDAIASVPLAIVGSSPPVLSWTSFARRHEATVQWIDPVLEHSDVKTPGEWQISLSVVQMAGYAVADIEPAGLIEWFGLSLAEQEQLGVEYIDMGVIYNGTDEYSAVESPLKGTYYAPENFVCPIPSDATFRFTNRLPADRPPIEVTDITVDDVPEGYDWPEHVDEYYPDESPVHYTGWLYPSGFTRGDYFSPPYIDVRQVKRSDIDVRKTYL